MNKFQNNKSISIYVHWPFCLSKCPYCDFNSHVADSVDHDLWLKSYQIEIDHFAGIIKGKYVKSIFFGGGTPSLMDPKTVAGVIEKISSIAAIDPETEITLEANPTSSEASKFKAFHSAGINRVSIGAQALNEKDLNALGRKHSGIDALKTIEIAKGIFPKASFDLIYARSGQTLRDWKAELKDAMDVAAGHISLYQLTIEKGTPFYKLFHSGELTLPNMDHAAHMYEYTTEYLSSKNYVRYEISNYAIKGHESKHNINYWEYGDYLGIGPGAHSRIKSQNNAGNFHEVIPNPRLNQTNDFKSEERGAYIDIGEHSKTHKNRLDHLKMGFGITSMMMWHRPETWLQEVSAKGCGVQKMEVLNSKDVATEILMMGLRLKDGLLLSNIKNATSIEFNQILNYDVIEHYTKLNLLSISNGRLRLTDKGLLLHSYIVPRLII